MEDVGQIAEARYEEIRMRLHEYNERGKGLLDTLIAVCRYSNEGINACAQAKLEQFGSLNHAVGITFHSGIENDLAVGTDAIPPDQLNKPFLPGQIAVTSTSTVNGASLFSLTAADSASGFRLVTTYAGQKLQNIFISSSVLGQSGETFLADNRGFFITKPRYPSQQGITTPITAVPMERCLRSDSNETLDLDYRNVRIIHGFRFVPEIGGGCIMAHIEQAEAFAPLPRLVMGLSIATLLFACSAWLIATMLGRSMTRPLIALTDMAQALSRGDFTQRVHSTGFHEIAELSRLFNSMSGQLNSNLNRLKASEQELEKKVVERSAEVQQRLSKYHSVIQNTGEGFWQVDREGRLLEVNPAYVRLSGYSEQELIGMRVTDLEAKETPEEIAGRIHKIMQRGTDTFETRHRRKNGSVWDVEVNASFINEEGGYFVCFFKDITERKRIKQELRIAATAFETLEGIIITDANEVIMRVNQAFTQITGYTPEEAIGNRPSILKSDTMTRSFIVPCVAPCNATASGKEKYGIATRMAISIPNGSP